jgi:hypothetical protein
MKTITVDLTVAEIEFIRLMLEHWHDTKSVIETPHGTNVGIKMDAALERSK